MSGERELLDRAIEAWDRGDFYDAHETLEDFAELLEDDDRDYAIALALVRIAASLHKLANGVGPQAVPGKLHQALQELADAPASWRGVALGELREALLELHAGLAPDRAYRAEEMPKLRRAG